MTGTEHIEHYQETPENFVNSSCEEVNEVVNHVSYSEAMEKTTASEASEVSPSQNNQPSRDNHIHDGDQTVQNNLSVGGVLRAKRIIHPWGCIFHSYKELSKEFPSPHPGMWAFVGTTYPYDLYRCVDDGMWTLVERNSVEYQISQYLILHKYATESWVKEQIKRLQLFGEQELYDYLKLHGFKAADDIELPDGVATKNWVQNAFVSKDFFDDLFEKIEVAKDKYSIKAKYDLFSVGNIEAVKSLISQQLARLKDGAEFGEFVSGMLTGIGGAIDKKGNAEFGSLTVRSSMRVMELIINRLGAQEGDTMFAESDTIETVTDNGDGTLLLKLQSKYDGYFTAMTPGMVVRGIINDLATGGGNYYTSWMRVNSVNASANTVEVSLYPDDEVPAGRNFPPCELMRMVRWGHQTDPTKQSIFYISSTEGRIVKLFRVTKPIIDFSNYEISLGTLPEKISEILPIALGESGIYVKNLVVEKIWQLDHQGKLLPTIRDRGPYDSAQMYYSGDTLRPETSDYEQSEVWYFGCKGRCMVTGVTSPPLWNSTSWAIVEGNPNFSIEFEEGNRIWLDPENIHGTLTIRGWLYNQDVTTDIQDSDIEWTRYTEDAAGVPQTASDNIWALSHATVGKQLTITSTDFPANPMSLKRVEFRVKVILRDARHDTTHEDEMIATFIN